jgi:hypothetical protein
MRLPRKVWPFAAVFGFLLLGALGLASGWYLAGDGTDPQAHTRQSPQVAVSPSPSRAKDDLFERSACQLAATWVAESRTADYELAQRIADSARSATPFDIRIRGQLLNDRLELAKASQGQRDHPRYQQDMVEAMDDLRAQCAKLGLS